VAISEILLAFHLITRANELPTVPALWYSVAVLHFVFAGLMVWGGIAAFRGKTNAILVLTAGAVAIVMVFTMIVEIVNGDSPSGILALLPLVLMVSMVTRDRSKEFFAARGGTKSLILLAALAVSAGGSLSLGAATAHADVLAACTPAFMSLTCTAEVQPGLTCNAGGWTTCTNATNRDYTVIETLECPGGSYTGYEYGYGFDPIKGEMGMTSNLLVTRYVDPSVEHSSIFVPANNTGTGPQGTGCPAGSATSVRYSVQ